MPKNSKLSINGGWGRVLKHDRRVRRRKEKKSQARIASTRERKTRRGRKADGKHLVYKINAMRYLGLVLGVLLGRGPRGGGELEALLVGDGRLLGLELGELFLHVLVVSGRLALLGTSSTGLLGRHVEEEGKKSVWGGLRGLRV